MIHAELINKIETEFSLSKRKSTKILRMIVDSIKEAVLAGETVKVANLGTFKNVSVAERTGIDPTGKKIVVPAHHKVKFTPSKSFKKELW